MYKNILASMLLPVVLHSSAGFSEELIKTDRYTLATVEAQGDQRAPLTTVVTMSFGVDIRTVGEAITELLNGSGYRWEPRTDDQSLNTLPLPSVVRTLGPIRLHGALGTVAGQAWTLNVDELRRVIWFEVRNAIGSSVN